MPHPSDPSERMPMRALRDIGPSLRRWFVTETEDERDLSEADRIDWVRVLPFLGLHLACLGVLVVGVSWIAVTVAALLYALRMFAITGFYHRYFSHRAFRT